MDPAFPEDLSPSFSTLSSVAALSNDVEVKLEEYSQHLGDDSNNFFHAFLQSLPRDGKRHLQDDIMDCDSPLILRELRDSLFTSLLCPCMLNTKKAYLQ